MIIKDLFYSEHATAVTSTDNQGMWWEFGSFLIPESQWTATKSKVLALYNVFQTELLQMAHDCYKELKTSLHGKRNKNYWDAFTHLPVKLKGQVPISSAIHAELFRHPEGRMYKPRLQSFPLAGQRSTRLDFPGGLHIGIDNQLHVFRWDLKYLLATQTHKISTVQEILRVLTSVNYTQGTGGVIHCVHGSIGYGPLGKVFA